MLFRNFKNVCGGHIEKVMVSASLYSLICAFSDHHDDVNSISESAERRRVKSLWAIFSKLRPCMCLYQRNRTQVALEASCFPQFIRPSRSNPFVRNCIRLVCHLGDGKVGSALFIAIPFIDRCLDRILRCRKVMVGEAVEQMKNWSAKKALEQVGTIMVRRVVSNIVPSYTVSFSLYTITFIPQAAFRLLMVGLGICHICCPQCGDKKKRWRLLTIFLLRPWDACRLSPWEHAAHLPCSLRGYTWLLLVLVIPHDSE